MIINVYDGSNLIHRSFYVANNASYNDTREKVLYHTVKMTLQTIFRLITECDASYAYVLLDRTKPSELIHSMKKFDEGREYDESRSSIISESMSLLQRYLNNCNLPCIHYPGLEADELAYVLSKCFAADHPNDLMWMISGDCDWFQCIAPNVKHWDPIRHRETDHQKMIQDYGEHYRLAYVAYEAMVRTKDGCTGVAGIGDATASAIMELVIDPINNYLKIPTEPLPVQPVYANAFHAGIKDFIKGWETIDYEWIVRSPIYNDVLEFLEGSRKVANVNLDVVDEVLVLIGRDKMNTCINSMNAYITRSKLYGTK